MNHPRDEAVLNDWPKGDPAKAIGARHGISGDLVLLIVHNARKAGDPRAVLRVQHRRPRVRREPWQRRAGEW